MAEQTEQLQQTIHVDNISIPIIIEPSDEVIIDEGPRARQVDVLAPISETAIEAHRKHDADIRTSHVESQTFLVAVSERATELHEGFIDAVEAEVEDAEKTLETRTQLIEANRAIALASINQMADRELESEAIKRNGRLVVAKNAKEQADRFLTRAQKAAQNLGGDIAAVAEDQTRYEVSRDKEISQINSLFQRQAQLISELADARQKHTLFSEKFKESNQDEQLLLEKRRTLRLLEIAERNMLSEQEVQRLSTELPPIDGIESDALIEAKRNVYAGVSSFELLEITKKLSIWEREWDDHQENAKSISDLIDQYELAIETITAELEKIPSLLAEAQFTLDIEETKNARGIEVFTVQMHRVSNTYFKLLTGDVTKVLQDSAPDELRFVVEEFGNSIAAQQQIDENKTADAWNPPAFDIPVPYPLRQKTRNDEEDDSEPQTFAADQQRIKTMQQFDNDIPVNILNEMKRPMAFVGRIGRSVLKPGVNIEYNRDKQ